MSGYRVVFCDIDGTLLDSEHRLPEATAGAVRDVARAGTPFVLVSARPPEAIYPFLDKMGLHSPVVAYSGALVLDGDRKPVHSIGIDSGVTGAIKRRINETCPDVSVSVYSFDKWIVDDASNPDVVMEAEITGLVPVEGRLEEHLPAGNEAHKLFCVGPAERISVVEKDLKREFPDLAVCQSKPYYLEIMNGAATKSNAVRYLCQAMRLPIGDSVAFGDNFNDIDMLAAAGLGVAMGNAPDEVKAVADRVALDNDHEGVRVMLAALGLRNMSHSTRFERAVFRR